jgi:hypothetical protein
MKHFHKLALMMAIALIALLPIAANSQQKTTKIDEAWRILISKKASKMDLFSAEELQIYIEKISGLKLPIVNDDEVKAEKVFIVGQHPYSAKIIAELKRRDSNDPDSFSLIVQKDIITMVGNSDTATSYAVWEWLESLGVRWFFPTPKGEYVPQLKTIESPIAARTEAPMAQYRSIWPWVTGQQGGPELFGELEHGIPAWQLHQLRMRSWSEDNPLSVYDRYRNLGHGHSYDHFLPASKYYDEHPEWFNLIEGKRLKQGAQVCFTNKGAAHEFANNIRKSLKNTEDGDPRRRIVWVSPNDTRAWCECPDCKKLVDKDGSATSMVFNFVNLVAMDLEKDYPEINLLCYAYYNHSTAPDHITLERAVTPILTYWAANDSFAINHARPGLSKDNPKFLREYEKWSRLCSQFGVYQYYGHYELFVPWPMQTQMKYDLEFFSKNPKFWGFCCEYHSNWGTQGLGLYLLAKLGWNPNQDDDALLRDYCRKAYGPAGEPMYRLYVAQQKAMDALPIMVGDQWEVGNMLTPEVVQYCDDQIVQVKARLNKMDAATKWRSELAIEGWRMSAAFARAYHIFNKGGGTSELLAMRNHMQLVKDSLDSSWGPLLIDSSINLPRIQQWLPRFFLPLDALKPGNHTYTDNMNYGGVTKFYANVENLTPEEWGWMAEPNLTGTMVLPLRAADGHEIQSAKFKWRTLGPNPVFSYKVSVTTAKGKTTFELPVVDKELEIPPALLPAKEAKLEIQVTNSSTQRSLNFYGLDMNLTIK